MNIKISKFDAAKRQLDKAIELFFKNADPVSIHTLACAAHEILADIARADGRITPFVDNLLNSVLPAYREEVRVTLREAQNFFKHANKDADDLLEFNPAQTEFILYDAVQMYFEFTSHKPVNMVVYRGWFFTSYPSALSDENQRKEYVQIARNYPVANRAAYLGLIHEIEKME